MRSHDVFVTPSQRDLVAGLNRRPVVSRNLPEATGQRGGDLPVVPAPAQLPQQQQQQRSRTRIDSIDLLRGAVMVLMALDHVRDFIARGGDMNPRDVHEPALFLTRWITHFCAPVFILLAGMSAYLYGSRPGRSKGDLARFLVIRGAWLILLELTIVRVGWTFSVWPDFVVLQVIWAIGASMIALAGLIYVPRWAVATFALAMIVGHNALDGVTAQHLGAAGWVWNVLHQPEVFTVAPGVSLLALYPLIPWVAVMALGYALGPIMQLHESQRRRPLLTLGALTMIGFVTLRLTNLYGDPVAWAVQDEALATVLSFVNVEKYPPSMLFLMATLGPAMVVLAYAETWRGRVANALVTFGRAPMAYYVVHVFLIHAIAVAVWWFTAGDVAWLFSSLPIDARPNDGGLPLWGVYAMWVLVVAALYPLCKWVAAVKARRKGWWLSYL